MHRCCKFLSYFLLTFLAFQENLSYAPPIGFYYNQGSLEFDELNSQNFLIYHDSRVPNEAKFYSDALEAARPHLESWIGVKRSSPLIVNMSAASDHASFANFIFDNIELQTLGQGPRDLAWHEYSHSTMYRHLDNIFGPAGAILHLPWMPAWYLEGFAEAFSVSVGSDVQSGIERYHALSGDWPSYDRLHSLYSSYDFALRGYATAGAFVTYLIRQMKSEDVPKFLEDFYWKSMPWMWPGTVVPFVDFMPMDSTFRKYFNGKTGEELYEEYKQKATAQWSPHAKDSFMAESNKDRLAFESTPRLIVKGDKVFDLKSFDHEIYWREISFDPNNGWASKSEQKELVAERVYGTTALETEIGKIHFSSTPIDTAGNRAPTLVLKQNKQKNEFTLNAAYAYALNQSGTDLFWIEGNGEKSRICFISKKSLAESGFQPDCKNEYTVPTSIEYLGAKTVGDRTQKIYVNLHHQTLTGDVHQIVEFDVATKKMTLFGKPLHQAPLQISFIGNEMFALVGGHALRTIQHLSASGECVSQTNLYDFIDGFWGVGSNEIALSVYAGKNHYVKKLSLTSLKQESCASIGAHSSPILEATRSPTPISLSDAFARSSTWSKPSEFKENKTPENPTQKTSEKYSWKGKPAFVFPWIGADDALGPQIGIVSVPLIDHLQNEMVRLTLLAGIYSRYPYQEVSLVSTRFRPTYSFAMFRSQTYNGRQYDLESKEIRNSFLDEKGGHFDSSWKFNFDISNLTLLYGVKVSNLKPYIGEDVKSGNLNEPYAGLSYDISKNNVTFKNSIAGRVAPKAMNKDFEYDVLGASTGINLYFEAYKSSLDTGIDASRTRGPKRRDLQEVYYPLKTFVPGSGGGYNKNSFPFIGVGSLFTPRFGDTQARYRINYTHPIISDFEKYFWILYVDRLDFSAFYNYGGTWYEGQKPITANFISSHGYNLDLQFDNKGVRFNFGVGTGQVIGDPFQIYVTSGFDALF